MSQITEATKDEARFVILYLKRTFDTKRLSSTKDNV